MISQPITQPQNYELFITYSLADQALMQRLLLQPLAQAGLRVITEHRQQPLVIERAGHPLRQSRAVLLAMSAASYKNMLAYAEMLRFTFEQLAATPPLWVVLLDQGVPQDQVSSFILWDFSARTGQVQQLARLIRRLSAPRTVALFAPPDLDLAVSQAHQLGAWLRRLGHTVLTLPVEDADWPTATRAALAQSDYLVAFVSEASAHSNLLAALIASAQDLFLANRRPRIIPVLQAGVSLPRQLAGHLEHWPSLSWDGTVDRRIYRLIAQALTLGGAPDANDSNANSSVVV